MMNALNLLFHRSTLPLSTLSHCPTDVFQQTLVPSPDSLIPFHSTPMQTSSLRFLVAFQNSVFRQLSVTIPSKQTSRKTSVSSTLPLLAYLAPKPTCDVLISQNTVYWKQRYAADAVQKIVQFAAMFGSVVYSHQPRVI